MSSKKQSTNKEKELCHKENDKKIQDNKCAIILDNIALKLGVKDKSEIAKVLKSKLEYLKTHNFPKYQELIGEN